ncbi:DUF2797 domain-containing protein [Halocatena salina]|uniref:DUF2797 domain-containing protein n=1 Tax=Halocatena salina TaxID=2934340 RepID=A0A8T9ZZW3_9EURY|nr:DUF2797 domain-containing protein [Halocatena salina]UPM42324.1 DUF2797 domain-containing protein [Halocatena salina]
MQVVGYRSDAGTLQVASAGSVKSLVLDSGVELDYTLGERHCAGTVTATGHTACEASSAPYCEIHERTWVCARCTGTCLKAEMDCYDTHAVYLAAFAPSTFKVGVTKRDRLRTRLHEQGADRAAHVRTVSNGRIAREIEQEIAADLPDRVRVPEKIAGLGRSVSDSAWTELLAAYDPIETFEFEYGLALRSQPVPETLLRGVVRGTKGRILVLDRDEGTYAVDLRDLVGYELTERTNNRHLQSALSAF